MDLSEQLDSLISPNPLWNIVLYKDEMIKIDIYYNSIGHPKYIHDEFGSEGILEFRIMLVKEILARNKACHEVWRVSSDAFAILHSTENCDEFELKYKNLTNKILKRTFVMRHES